MWKHSGTLKAFTENIRDRLQSEYENEKWKVLLRQRQLLEEYGQSVDRLRQLDLQISRLVESPPPMSIGIQLGPLIGVQKGPLWRNGSWPEAA